MKDFSLSRFRKEIEKTSEQKEHIRKEIEQRKIDAKKLRSYIESAITEGDIETYNVLKKNLAEIESETETLTVMLNGLRPQINQSEISDAWNAWVKEYNKDFVKIRDSYKKHLSALCDNFLSMMDMQDKALRNSNEAFDLITKSKAGKYDLDDAEVYTAAKEEVLLIAAEAAEGKIYRMAKIMIDHIPTDDVNDWECHPPFSIK